MILKHIETVNKQLSFHEYASHKFNSDPEKRDKQLELKSRFASLLSDLKELNSLAESFKADTIQDLVIKVEDLNDQSTTSTQLFPDITPDDIRDLSEEEFKKLGLSEAAQSEFQIVDYIDSIGGVASVRKVMIGLRNITGTMPEKQTLNNRLYRMTQKDQSMLFMATDYGQGFYTTKPPKSDDDLDVVDELFDPDDDLDEL